MEGAIPEVDEEVDAAERRRRKEEKKQKKREKEERKLAKLQQAAAAELVNAEPEVKAEDEGAHQATGLPAPEVAHGDAARAEKKKRKAGEDGEGSKKAKRRKSKA